MRSTAGRFAFQQRGLIDVRSRGFRTFSTGEAYNKLYRWWEKSDKLKSLPAGPSEWWSATASRQDVEEKATHERIRKELAPLTDFVLQKPSPKFLAIDDSETFDGTMTSLVEPLLKNAKSDAERNYLSNFIGKPCLIGKEFFDIPKWSKFWFEMSQDYQSQKSKWEVDYQKRKAERRLTRIRVHEGVQARIEDIFTPERAEALWGKDWRKINRLVQGFVMKKEGDVYSVLWAVPGNNFEMIVHQGDSKLDTVYPQEYVPDFDKFQYVPMIDLTPEVWIEQTLSEHPLLIITESRDDPRYLRACEIVQGAVFGTIDLSREKVSEDIRKRIKTHLVQLTNWPTFPQIFLTSTFLGGLENLEALKDSGSLDTVLLMAGAKSKTIVEREADKYTELMNDRINEWRFKRMERLTKILDQGMLGKGDEPEGVARAITDDERQKYQTMMDRLSRNDDVDDLYYADLRGRFIRDSALEIERLGLLFEASKTKFLIMEEDERITVETLSTALGMSKVLKKKSPSRQKLAELLRKATEGNDIDSDFDLSTDSDAALVDETAPALSTISSEVSSEADIEVDTSTDDEDDPPQRRLNLINVIRSINEELAQTPVYRRRDFAEILEKVLSGQLSEDSTFEQLEKEAISLDTEQEDSKLKTGRTKSTSKAVDNIEGKQTKPAIDRKRRQRKVAEPVDDGSAKPLS